MKDPIEDLAYEQMLELSAELVVQLEQGPGTRPVLFMLSRSRKRAALALTALVTIDPNDKDKIVGFQNEIRLYDDMITATREMLAKGQEAANAIDERDRGAIADIAMSPEDERLYNVNRGFDA